MSTLCVASTFVQNVTNTWGDDGRAWLASLPQLIDECTQEWLLKDLRPVPNLSYNYVLTGVRISDGAPIVLKLCFNKYAKAHESSICEREVRALRFYEGGGCVQLYDTNIDRGALLLEHVLPGEALNFFGSDLHGEERAVMAAVQVMKQLHARPIKSTDSFPSVVEWLKHLRAKNSSIPSYHLDKADVIARELLNTQGTDVLLHGDLHHDNILSSARSGWLSIDPKGIKSEVAYEVGAFIRNPFNQLLQHPNAKEIISYRLHAFAKHLSVDVERLRAWSYVQAVLAAVWAEQDNASFEPWMRIAENIEGAS